MRSQLNSMNVVKAEKAYEKHAWILLFLLGLFGLTLGGNAIPGVLPPLTDITGLSWDENSPQAMVALEHLRTVSQWIFFSAIFIMVLAAVPYRRGERWSWFVLWALPVNLTIGAARDLALGYTGFFPLWWPFILILIIVALVGLLLPYRKFFPGK